MSDVTIDTTFSRIRIRIKGIVHLSLKQSHDIQIQSWLYPDKGYYAIEYYSCGVVILCEYDNKELWGEILKQLEEHKII